MTKIQEAKKIIEEADKIVIGAGAGLSAAAGLAYSGSRFEVFFKDYIARYGMQDMYSAAFYPFEKMTAVFPKAHLIRLNRDDLEGFAATKEKTISINDDMREVLRQWLAE